MFKYYQRHSEELGPDRAVGNHGLSGFWSVIEAFLPRIVEVFLLVPAYLSFRSRCIAWYDNSSRHLQPAPSCTNVHAET